MKVGGGIWVVMRDNASSTEPDSCKMRLHCITPKPVNLRSSMTDFISTGYFGLGSDIGLPPKVNATLVLNQARTLRWFSPTN